VLNKKESNFYDLELVGFSSYKQRVLDNMIFYFLGFVIVMIFHFLGFVIVMIFYLLCFVIVLDN